MSSSSYTPSSDDYGDSQSQLVQPFGRSAPSQLKKRAERHQAALNSIANNTVRQYYKPGGALDSQTTETQWVNKLYQNDITTPPRRAVIVQPSPQISRRSPTLSDNNTSADGGLTSDVFNMGLPNNLEQGDITLVDDMRYDIGSKAKLIQPVKENSTLSVMTDNDIPVASSPPPVLALSTIQTFEEYNEFIGSLGGAQLPPGWSDGPEILVARSPSPIGAMNCMGHDLTDLEHRILTAVRSLVEDKTEAITERADNALEGHWQEVSGLYDAARQQDRYISKLRELLWVCNVDVPEM
ncbi:uncharacterized protein ARMOST_20039 [Armillaria ostoyae]|uniref:Uncharacterized protein n=1 Tax=Armillaria ostoyae TaxID=47428 RepID=A0A284S675_ARMOS|nr:uncharacterized protein ARMOST_20039 [Armillaria ostoyae]